MAGDKRFERLSGIVEGQKGSYEVKVTVIPPKDPKKVQLDFNYEIKVHDVNTEAVKLSQGFVLRQGQSFTVLEDVVRTIKESAARDFK